MWFCVCGSAPVLNYCQIKHWKIWSAVINSGCDERAAFKVREIRKIKDLRNHGLWFVVRGPGPVFVKTSI